MLSRGSQSAMHAAFSFAVEFFHKNATVMHLLLALLDDADVKLVMENCFARTCDLKNCLSVLLATEKNNPSLAKTDCSNGAKRSEVKPSSELCDIVHASVILAHSEGICEVTPTRLLYAILYKGASDACKFFFENGVNFDDVISAVSVFEEQQKLKPIRLPYGCFDPNTQKGKKSSVAASAAEQQQQNKKFGSFQIIGANAEDPLTAYCINLNEQVRCGKVDAVIGRDHLIDKTVRILSRRRRNNPIYVGEPGVGKSALVDGLVVKISRGEIPQLNGIEIYSLDMASLVAGTRYRGDFEERIKSLIATIMLRKNVILFIDEAHLIVGAGSTTGGSLDASNLLKPVLSRGMFRCIGATTCKEYSLSFEKDPALARRFQRIDVDESSVDETVQVLNGIKRYYENYHNVIYTKSSLKLIAEVADKYITGQMMPDKAVGLMDDAGVLVKFSKNPDKVVRCYDVRKAAGIVIGKDVSGDIGLTFSAVAEINNELHKNILGQDHAISMLVNALRISAMGLRRQERPILSALFVGPTGVGKTAIANHLARLMKVKLIRFDMSEYSESHSVSKIIGSPPGYVGYDSGGLLTAEVSRCSHSVILLDEMEKAHKDVYNLFLQVMDYGWMSDTFGRKVDFRNTIIIMTSNVGVSESIESGYGFENQKGSISMSRIQKAVERTFSPEFRGRLDSVIFFNPLEGDVIEKIVLKFISEFHEKLASKGILFSMSDDAVGYIVKHVYKGDGGIRCIESFFRNSIASSVVNLFAGSQSSSEKSKVHVTYDQSLSGLKYEIVE